MLILSSNKMPPFHFGVKTESKQQHSAGTNFLPLLRGTRYRKILPSGAWESQQLQCESCPNCPLQWLPRLSCAEQEDRGSSRQQQQQRGCLDVLLLQRRGTTCSLFCDCGLLVWLWWLSVLQTINYLYWEAKHHAAPNTSNCLNFLALFLGTQHSDKLWLSKRDFPFHTMTRWK